MADFPRMSIPYRGDKYTGKSKIAYGQYIYELDRAGELFWTHTMPSTAVRQGIIPASAAGLQSGSEGQERPVQTAPDQVAHIDTIHPQMPSFADLRDSYKDRFYALMNMMSPENLAEDGEVSQKVIQGKKKWLLSQWRKLEKEVGFPVSMDEVENWK